MNFLMPAFILALLSASPSTQPTVDPPLFEVASPDMAAFTKGFSTTALAGSIQAFLMPQRIAQTPASPPRNLSLLREFTRFTSGEWLLRIDQHQANLPFPTLLMRRTKDAEAFSQFMQKTQTAIPGLRPLYKRTGNLFCISRTAEKDLLNAAATLDRLSAEAFSRDSLTLKLNLSNLASSATSLSRLFLKTRASSLKPPAPSSRFEGSIKPQGRGFAITGTIPASSNGAVALQPSSAPEGTALFFACRSADLLGVYQQMHSVLNSTPAMTQSAATTAPTSIPGTFAIALGAHGQTPFFVIVWFLPDSADSRQTLDQRLRADLFSKSSVRTGVYHGAVYDAATSDHKLIKEPTVGLIESGVILANSTDAFRLAIDAQSGASSLGATERFGAVASLIDPKGAAFIAYEDFAHAGQPFAFMLGSTLMALRENPDDHPTDQDRFAALEQLRSQLKIFSVLSPGIVVGKLAKAGISVSGYDEGGMIAPLLVLLPLLAPPEAGMQLEAMNLEGRLALAELNLQKAGRLLEDLHRERGSYPPPIPLPEGQTLEHEGGGFELNSLTFYPPPEFAALAAPWLTKDGYPADPFAPHGIQPFAYALRGDQWLIFSAGPDGVYDIRPENDFDPVGDSSLSRLAPKTYDPSNGIFSSGDLWSSSAQKTGAPSGRR